VENLERVAELLFDMGLGPLLGVDLGEVRGAGYYTGVSFALFAKGPGEAIASGGRYDQLLARYGKPLPATGAGIDVENLLWALDHAGADWRAREGVRFLIAGDDATRVRNLADAIRQTGFATSTLADADEPAALRYASAWALDVVIVARGHSPLRALQAGSGLERELPTELTAAEIEELAAWWPARLDARGSVREQSKE
jgi:ATP phosphoribosyltransferase regulatory subunit